MNKIMFNDKFLLTKAVLEGRKTQTRRIVPQKELDKISLFQKGYYDATFDKLEGVELLKHYFLTEKYGKFPYNVGEVVAVAQSYCSIADELENCNNATCVAHYEKNVQKASEYISWMEHPGFNNKMFVAADIMPYKIRINDVRVERLQDISEKDAISEGIIYAGLTYKDYGEPMFIIEGCKQAFGSAKDAYAWLIDKISGKGTWQSNPYVFVYDFELIK